MSASANNPRESNVGHMQQLTDFETIHAAFGKFLILHASFKDTMTGVPHWSTQDFPDQDICITREKAIELIESLQRAVDYIDAGLEHPSWVTVG